MIKHTLLALAGLSALAQPALAQDFPASNRTLTIVVPSTAGGGSDVVARLFQPLLEEELGIPVQVENRAGASMQIGTSYVTHANPDGYTVLWAVLPTIASAYLDEERGADFTREDLVPIVGILQAPTTIAVLATSPYETLQDVVAAAKANPASVRSGTTGVMATGHFANIGFQQAAGTQMPMVHFQGGGPELVALLGGHIDVAFNASGEVIEHQRAGTIRVLATMANERHPLLPDVATLDEQGFGAVAMGSVNALVAPPGTPENVIAVLADAMRKAAEDPDLQAQIAAQGSILEITDAATFAALWDNMDADVGALIPIAKRSAE